MEPRCSWAAAGHARNKAHNSTDTDTVRNRMIILPVKSKVLQCQSGRVYQCRYTLPLDGLAAGTWVEKPLSDSAHRPTSDIIHIGGRLPSGLINGHSARLVGRCRRFANDQLRLEAAADRRLRAGKQIQEH